MANDRSGLDVARLRADTRGCAEVVHLNNAGSALPPSIVVDTMVEHLRREGDRVMAVPGRGAN